MSTVVDTVPPSHLHQSSTRRQHRLYRITRDPRHLARRAVSATQLLAWQLDITVVIDADVYTDDRADAAAMFTQHLLHPQTHLTVVSASLHPLGWRDIATGPITALRDVTVDDGNADINLPWIVRAWATLRITGAASDLDPNMFVEFDPAGPATWTVRNVLAVIHTVTRTTVRRRR